jgi:hypothetical protein
MLDIDSEGCLDSYSKIVLTPKKITSLAKSITLNHQFYQKPQISNCYQSTFLTWSLMPEKSALMPEMSGLSSMETFSP